MSFYEDREKVAEELGDSCLRRCNESAANEVRFF